MIGYIYKIYIKDCPEFNKVYIGSTSRKVHKRISEHKYKFNKGIKDTRSYYIYEYANNNGLKISYDIIEKFEYNSWSDMLLKELKYIRENDNIINKI